MTRLAGAEAAPLLAALHDAAMPGDGWAADAFARLLSMPGCFAIMAEAGFVLARVAADEAEIVMLAVLPTARRRGLGQRLLGQAMAHAAGAGARAMFLEVAESNRAAQALYAAAGFTLVGRRPRYYPDSADALVLRRALSPGGT